jgi:hypothetical protein
MKQTILVSILLAGASASTFGDIIFNSFGPGNSFSSGGRLLQGENVFNIGNVDQAASFVVGPNNYAVTSITLGLTVGGINGGAGPIDFVLTTDNSGVPGGVLETLSGNVASGSTQVITRSASGATILNANTTYWIIADAKGLFDGSWGFNDQGIKGLTAGRSANSGTVNYGAWSTRPNDDQLAFRVEGRITNKGRVPDSGHSLALLGLTTLALTGLARRRE